MTRTLSLSEVKINLSWLVAEIVRRDDQITITCNGKPAAVLISVEKFVSMKKSQSKSKGKRKAKQSREKRTDKEFDEVRRRSIPYAQARGIYTDEDVERFFLSDWKQVKKPLIRNIHREGISAL